MMSQFYKNLCSNSEDVELDDDAPAKARMKFTVLYSPKRGSNVTTRDESDRQNLSTVSESSSPSNKARLSAQLFQAAKYTVASHSTPNCPLKADSHEFQDGTDEPSSKPCAYIETEKERGKLPDVPKVLVANVDDGVLNEKLQDRRIGRDHFLDSFEKSNTKLSSKGMEAENDGNIGRLENFGILEKCNVADDIAQIERNEQMMQPVKNPDCEIESNDGPLLESVVTEESASTDVRTTRHMALSPENSAQYDDSKALAIVSDMEVNEFCDPKSSVVNSMEVAELGSVILDSNFKSLVNDQSHRNKQSIDDECQFALPTTPFTAQFESNAEEPSVQCQISSDVTFINVGQIDSAENEPYSVLQTTEVCAEDPCNEIRINLHETVSQQQTSTSQEQTTLLNKQTGINSSLYDPKGRDMFHPSTNDQRRESKDPSLCFIRANSINASMDRNSVVQYRHMPEQPFEEVAPLSLEKNCKETNVQGYGQATLAMNMTNDVSLHVVDKKDEVLRKISSHSRAIIKRKSEILTNKLSTGDQHSLISNICGGYENMQRNNGNVSTEEHDMHDNEPKTVAHKKIDVKAILKQIKSAKHKPLSTHVHLSSKDTSCKQQSQLKENNTIDYQSGKKAKGHNSKSTTHSNDGNSRTLLSYARSFDSDSEDDQNDASTLNVPSNPESINKLMRRQGFKRDVISSTTSCSSKEKVDVTNRLEKEVANGLQMLRNVSNKQNIKDRSDLKCPGKQSMVESIQVPGSCLKDFASCSFDETSVPKILPKSQCEPAEVALTCHSSNKNDSITGDKEEGSSDMLDIKQKAFSLAKMVNDGTMTFGEAEIVLKQARVPDSTPSKGKIADRLGKKVSEIPNTIMNRLGPKSEEMEWEDLSTSEVDERQRLQRMVLDSAMSEDKPKDEVNSMARSSKEWKPTKGLVVTVPNSSQQRLATRDNLNKPQQRLATRDNLNKPNYATYQGRQMLEKNHSTHHHSRVHDRYRSSYNNGERFDSSAQLYRSPSRTSVYRERARRYAKTKGTY